MLTAAATQKRWLWRRQIKRVMRNPDAPNGSASTSLCVAHASLPLIGGAHD
jgi:hypothetical protein